MTKLVPDGFYWARSDKHNDGEVTVVRVSTIFGAEPEYWTLVVLGCEQHHMPCDFKIIERLSPPEENPLKQAAE